jgi:hypothetical protein
MKNPIPRERVREKPGLRYAVCIRCRKVYNISARQDVPYYGYVCPCCAGKRW